MKSWKFAAATVLGPLCTLPWHGAAADDMFWLMPKSEVPSPVLAGWTATISPIPEPTVSARDPQWTAKVASLQPLATNTREVDERRSHEAPAGPRLTGQGHDLSGVASYYWQDQLTATGEQFDKRDLTAAHRTLPFGTRVRVTRVDNGSSVIVRINDRGPFKAGRIIDLSERAAEHLGMTSAGVAPVQLEVLGP